MMKEQQGTKHSTEERKGEEDEYPQDGDDSSSPLKACKDQFTRKTLTNLSKQLSRKGHKIFNT